MQPLGTQPSPYYTNNNMYPQQQQPNQNTQPGAAQPLYHPANTNTNANTAPTATPMATPTSAPPHMLPIILSPPTTTPASSTQPQQYNNQNNYPRQHQNQNQQQQPQFPPHQRQQQSQQQQYANSNTNSNNNQQQQGGVGGNSRGAAAPYVHPSQHAQTLFVKGLKAVTTTDDVTAYFTQWGTVSGVDMFLPRSDKPIACYVRYSDPAEALRAIAASRRHVIDGADVVVNSAATSPAPVNSTTTTSGASSGASVGVSGNSSAANAPSTGTYATSRSVTPPMQVMDRTASPLTTAAAQSTHKVLVLWDTENGGGGVFINNEFGGASEASHNNLLRFRDGLQKLAQQVIGCETPPDVECKAVANTQLQGHFQINKQARHLMMMSGWIQLIDASEKPGAVDIQLFQMFIRLMQDHYEKRQTPAAIILVTGDGDFISMIQWAKTVSLPCVLISDETCVHGAMKAEIKNFKLGIYCSIQKLLGLKPCKALSGPDQHHPMAKHAAPVNTTPKYQLPAAIPTAAAASPHGMVRPPASRTPRM
ncbi:hypothetical protein Pelo_14634 [Pelomyxa schiedti]|nr:hypothetical protein Pelo_14634 [Pelomyxa schiedti]